MIQFDPTTLYGREDLIKLFEPFGINWDRFQAKLAVPKVSRFAWWGRDLIEALDRAPRLAAVAEPAAVAVAEPGKRKASAAGRRRAGRGGVVPLHEQIEATLRAQGKL